MPAEMATNADGSKIYVANYGGTVASINPATLSIVDSYQISGEDATAIMATPTNDTVIVGTRSGKIRRIKLANGTGTILATKTGLPTGDDFHFAWSQNRSLVYVASNVGCKIYELNAASLVLMRTFNIDDATGFGVCPQGMALSADGTQLLVTSNGGTASWNIAANSLGNWLGNGCGGFLLLLPDNSRLYTSCDDAASAIGHVYALNPTTLAVLEDRTVGGIPRQMSYDAGSGRVIVANEMGEVDILETAPPLGGTPDPTLLPGETTAQMLDTVAYDALHVPTLAAGKSYLDPTTNVRIYKLTADTFPTSSSSWGHDYAEGGNEVSLPYSGNTRAVLVHGIDIGEWWLVDFTPGVGVGNRRKLIGRLAPWSDGAFTFSSNPQTPYYAYVGNSSGRVDRINIGSMTVDSGDGWPREGETQVAWLHQSENDAFFTWMRGQSGPVVVGYEPSSRLLRTLNTDTLLTTPDSVDQPQINRDGSVRQVAINTKHTEKLILWDFTQDVKKCTADGTAAQFNHMGALRDLWLGINWKTSRPHDYHVYDTNCVYQRVAGPANADDYYANGNWNQPLASTADQWALVSIQSGLVPTLGTGYFAPGGMVYVKASGDRRLLGYPYNTSTSYSKYSFAKQSSDGRYVLFTSNMNGLDGSHTDVFLVEVPDR
jgi:hypothetical protein